LLVNLYASVLGFLCFTIVSPSLAFAQRLSEPTEVEVPKYALVIGNRDYDRFPRVPTAVNDAITIANRLHSLNFDVVVRTNASYSDILLEVKELRERIERVASENMRPVAVLYFSGHGFIVSGRQFIAGVRVSNTDRDGALRSSAAVQTLIDELANKSILVSYLDACRSDLGITDSAGQRATTSTSDGPSDMKGLGSMRGAALPSRQEYLIAYANQLGEPVKGFLMRGDINSPYTKILDAHMGDGRDVMSELYRVHEEVQRLVPNHNPDNDVSMNGKVFLYFSAATLARIRADWTDVSRSPTEEKMRGFVSDYENGPLTYRALQWLQSPATH
jgi:Caspase domain